MELIDFQWLRCLPDGFQIVRKPARKWTKSGGRIIEGAPPSVGLVTEKRWFELYRPTDFPELFQRFADMPATAEGMRDFFNTFGPLALPGGGAPTAGLINYYGIVLGEALADHARLRHAINLFQTGDPSALAQGFNAASQALNARWGYLRPELRPRSSGKVAIVWVPSSLIQFLWVQLALYAASDAQLFSCEQCGDPFLVGTGTRRRSKAKYCSNACRLAAFRERHGRNVAHA
jgi:hypothetical protein